MGELCHQRLPRPTRRRLPVSEPLRRLPFCTGRAALSEGRWAPFARANRSRRGRDEGRPVICVRKSWWLALVPSPTQRQLAMLHCAELGRAIEKSPARGDPRRFIRSRRRAPPLPPRRAAIGSRRRGREAFAARPFRSGPGIPRNVFTRIFRWKKRRF